jgi:hypothetical protein
MEKYDLIDQPHLIFKIDEKGITVDHPSSRVVAGSEIHCIVRSRESSIITII